MDGTVGHIEGTPGRPEHTEHQYTRHEVGGNHHLPDPDRGGHRASVGRYYQGHFPPSG